MEKKKYETPVVAITNWMSEDIITSSGLTSAATTLAITTSDENIASVSYDKLAQ
jgi:hypothetical protein